jgi:hypothetical protein
MRRVLLTFAIVFTIAIAGSAFAQTTPYFQVYFDAGLKDAAADCPAAPIGTVFDTLYVVAHNFDTWIMGAEFTIDYSTLLTVVGEEAVGADLTIGQSQSGIAMVWQTPRNGYNPVVMLIVTVVWECNDCAGLDDTEIVVREYPDKPSPRCVDFWTEEYVDGVGMTSLICSSLPVENTSWGQIKALYH